MSTFDWKATQFEERWFHALACLLARTNRQQESHAIDEAQPSDSCDSDADSEDEMETTSPRNNAWSLGKKALKEKFLDRLAEVMAREVDQKGDDVFAAGSLDFEDRILVYLARNGGILDTHKRIMRLIQIWLKAVASSGEHRAIEKDKMWSELVIWSLPRLEHYRDQLRSSFASYDGPLWEIRSAATRSKLKALRICCTETGIESADGMKTVWTEIITLCFELRYEPSLLPELQACLSATKANLMWRNIAFLGRLRSAFVSLNYNRLVESTDSLSYETFTEFALQFQGVKAIGLCDIRTPPSPGFPAFTSTELLESFESAGIDLDSLAFKEKGAKVKSKTRKLQILQADLEQPVRVHAEIQILMQLADMNDKTVGLKKFDYIGCSKRSCYLCSCLLKGFHRMRGSHGKVYPRWTVSSSSLLDSWESLKLHSKVSEIGTSMIERLRSPTKFSIPYVAESSAGMTATYPSESSHKYRGLLDRERARSKGNTSSTEPEPLLGQELKKIDVLRIPADGKEPSIVKIPIRGITDAYRFKDSFASDVPDFGSFWEDQLNFDRSLYAVEITNQESIELGLKAMNGKYLIYFNRSEELPPNEYLKKKLVDGTIPIERKFWNGDVFMVKLATMWIEPVQLAGLTRTEKIEVKFDDNAHAMYDDVSFSLMQIQDGI